MNYSGRCYWQLVSFDWAVVLEAHNGTLDYGITRLLSWQQTPPNNMCQPGMIDLSSNKSWVGYFNGLKLLITIAGVTLIDDVLIAGWQSHLHFHRTQPRDWALLWKHGRFILTSAVEGCMESSYKLPTPLNVLEFGMISHHRHHKSRY